MHSFQSLLADLGTLCLNTVVTTLNPDYPLTVSTRPTPVQRKAFDLLGVPLTAASNPPPAAGCTQ